MRPSFTLKPDTTLNKMKIKTAWLLPTLLLLICQNNLGMKPPSRYVLQRFKVKRRKKPHRLTRFEHIRQKEKTLYDIYTQANESLYRARRKVALTALALDTALNQESKEFLLFERACNNSYSKKQIAYYKKEFDKSYAQVENLEQELRLLKRKVKQLERLVEKDRQQWRSIFNTHYNLLKPVSRPTPAAQGVKFSPIKLPAISAASSIKR